MPATTSPLEGKIAIVTGGTKGIGLATALKLRSLGAFIVVNYSSDSSAAEEAVKKIGGPEYALAIKANIGVISDIRKLVDTVVEKFHKIDIVVNNAGIMIHETPSTITEESYDKSHAINVKGPIFLTRFASPHIPEGGRIIFISTSLTGASAVRPNYAVYITAKGAIEQFSRASAKEFGAKNITVNTVSPGPTSTELFTSTNNEQSTAMVKAMTPSNRIGEPEEIANAIAFLVSPDGSWVNGQNLRVNGGFVV